MLDGSNAGVKRYVEPILIFFTPPKIFHCHCEAFSALNKPFLLELHLEMVFLLVRALVCVLLQSMEFNLYWIEQFSTNSPELLIKQKLQNLPGLLLKPDLGGLCLGSLSCWKIQLFFSFISEVVIFILGFHDIFRVELIFPSTVSEHRPPADRPLIHQPQKLLLFQNRTSFSSFTQCFFNLNSWSILPTESSRLYSDLLSVPSFLFCNILDHFFPYFIISNLQSNIRQ